MELKPGNPDDGINGAPTPRGQLLGVSVASGLLYVAVAWFITRLFSDSGMYAMFSGEASTVIQLVIGAAFGIAASAAVGGLFFRTTLRDVLTDYDIIRYILEMRLRPADALQLSLVAGVTEEILFRGTVQPLLGIWWTSAIFIGLHGYFKWNRWAHIVFGGCMFVLSVGLGLLFEAWGIYAAMMGHTVYDLLMLASANWRSWTSRARTT